MSINPKSETEFFADIDAEYVARHTHQLADLTIDLSKQGLSDAQFATLNDLANTKGVPKAFAALMGGDTVNVTEKRAAWHAALRFPEATLQSDARCDGLVAMWAQLNTIAFKFRSQTWCNAKGTPITDVVHLGIGGSDLGPRLLCDALAPYQSGDTNVHFVSSLDPQDLDQTLVGLNPATTVFIVASKSFSTQETLENAKRARAWLHTEWQHEQDNHWIAITSRIDKAIGFGIPKENCLEMPEWVGGRYSIWSAIALPAIITFGLDVFQSFLEGAHAVDQAILTTETSQNAVMQMALCRYHQVREKQMPLQAVVPYSAQLTQLVPYLQQLDMESLGKSVSISGRPIEASTGSVIFGQTGTEGQHAFHQWLHQNPIKVPVDAIVIHQPQETDKTSIRAQLLLVAHALAQTQVLAFGDESSDPHQRLSGGVPSTLIHLPQLTPQTLGQLLALYEGVVFCLSQLYEINAFDQFGVEAGKRMASQLQRVLLEEGLPVDQWDASTKQAISLHKQWNKHTDDVSSDGAPSEVS